MTMDFATVWVQWHGAAILMGLALGGGSWLGDWIRRKLSARRGRSPGSDALSHR